MENRKNKSKTMPYQDGKKDQTQCNRAGKEIIKVENIENFLKRIFGGPWPNIG